MKNIHAFVAALALAATTTATAIIEERWGGEGWGGDGNETTSYVTSYTTFTTDIYTTYCPSPTKVTIGTKTYTVTTSETLTVTDCPCTVTKPVKPTTSASGMPTKPANTTSCPTQTKSSNSTITPTVPVISSSAGLNTSIVHITSLFVTTVPPGSTAIVVSGTTFPVTKPGEVTIPIVTASPLPPTQTPNQPQVSPTAPLQIENNGVQNGASLGAFVAGLVALLL